MPLQSFKVTIGSSATQLIAPVTGHRTPWQEIQFDPAIIHDTYIGLGSTTSATNYIIKLPANGTVPRTIASGPAAIKVDDLENLYVSGTQNDILYGYVITL